MTGDSGQMPLPRGGGARTSASAGGDTLIRIETLLKLAAGAAVAVAALGFPAVAAQLYRFNVPLDYFSSTQAIRAGVLPAFALALGAALLIVITRWAGAAFLAVAGASGVIGIPVAFVLFLAFTVAPTMLLIWAVLWLPSRLLAIFVDISNRDLLYAAAVLTALWALIANVGMARPTLLPGALGRFFARARNAEQSRQRRAIQEGYEQARRQSDLPQAAQGERSDSEPDESAAVSSDSIWTYVAMAAALGAMAIVLAYSVKLVTHLLGLRVSAEITLLRSLLAIGALALVAGVVALLLKGLHDLGNEEKRSSRIRTFAAVFGAVYVASIALYAWQIYPALPQRYSGGKPEPVVVWLKREDLPVGLRQSSPDVRLAIEDGWIRLEGLNLLSATSDRVILVDRTSPPSIGFVIPRENVKTLVWAS